jgi:bis(5'-nucleosidyl)-tetraphosphatase|tara:strand:- start:2369 stop:2830 length:462 start_codon:yes stop_codon:yes gene_type:complete
MKRIFQEYIKTVVRLQESEQSLEAAGIVVIKMFDDVPKVLILKKYDGTWDITKGKIDKGELSFEAALREVEEESGINDLNFMWGVDSIRYGKGEVFVGLTKSDPYIPINPKTNQQEHTELKFVSFKEAHQLVQDYLKNAILWAQNKVLEDKNE